MRITDLNKASHFGVVTSELVWVLMGRRWIDVQGKSGYLGESGRRNREGGDLCRLRHRAVFSGGRLQQLQYYYKAGLLGFMNKARK